MKSAQSRFLFCLLVLGSLIAVGSGVDFFRRMQSGSIFFVDSTTPKKMRTEFRTAQNGGERVKILIVPGHDADAPGAAFEDVTELGLNLELGMYLKNLFAADTRFNVVLAQDAAGYDSVLEKYFSEKEAEILEFRRQKHLGMYSVQQTGFVTSTIQVEHNNAPESSVTRLYGMNKWANENKVDLVIHVHFNDNPLRDRRYAGRYSGVALYIPEHQYSNAAASRALAEPVFKRLTSKFPASDLPPEKGGIIEDQELIGLGASNSLDPASIFIEYAYIYEPQFQYESIRKLWTQEAALQTYFGVIDFFENKEQPAKTAVLPHTWKKDMGRGLKNDIDVFALQSALLLEGMYPPPGRTKNDCPLSGTYFDCTEKAVFAFQKKYHLPQTRYADRLTRAQLLILYGE